MEVYGDIPRRPLFLGMLAEDAWLSEEPARELHRLYGKYFRAKFSLDQYSVAGGGVSSRSSGIVEALGVEEAVERLILIMQDVAGAMAFPAGPATRAQAVGVVHEDTIAEDALQVIIRRHGIEFFQMEDVVLHTLLQPAGRSRVTRHRLVRFAHRSFQDWFLARKLAFDGNDGARLEASSAAARFLASMRADLSNGGDLP